MINIKEEKNCCGCMACVAVCPINCITVEKATLGTKIAMADSEKCISCGKCEKVCPMLHNDMKNTTLRDTYAAFQKESKIRFRGSSGGMFETFARVLIKEGYVVYGAAFDKELKLKCTLASNFDELEPLTKSKYLQSDMSDKYIEIKQKLENGEKVLFVSTPCQNAALKLFLNKEYENLLMVDFLCHGVPSQSFFDECIRYTEEKEHIKITDFQFRTKKKNGSTPHYYTMKYRKNDKEYKKQGYYFDFPFYAAFQQYTCLRESCYDCKFAVKERVTDITISDFHDIDRYIKGINRFDGVSMVFIHTEKGKKLWEMSKNELVTYELDLDVLIKDKVCFSGGTQKTKRRDELVNCYKQLGINAVVDRYLSSRLYKKQRLYYSMPSIVRKMIKKIVGV